MTLMFRVLQLFEFANRELMSSGKAGHLRAVCKLSTVRNTAFRPLESAVVVGQYESKSR